MAKLLSHIAVGAFALVATACGPSIDPAAKADIDRRVATLAPGAQTFPAPAVFAPRPMAVGQWTMHKMLDDKGQPSFMTYKIVGEEAGAFWIEVVREDYFGKP